MNKLLDFYNKMLYFCKGEPTTLRQLDNRELNQILSHIKRYPQGMLNGYDKQQYVNAVNYIISCRKNFKNHKINLIETRLANKALDSSEELSKLILNCMIYTEKRYKVY